MDPVDRAQAHRAANQAAILASFRDLLSIPNVAADPENLQRTAEWIRDSFRERMVDAATSALPGAPPVVFGIIPGRTGGPRYGIYAHYDGQPVDPLRWSNPPFEPTLLSGSLEAGGEHLEFPAAGEPVDPEWRIYARGASDDRAPIAALLAAVDALDGAQPDATIVFLFEGEEEIGSPHLPEYLRLLGGRLGADAWLICDGPVHQTRRAQVAYGVRGFAEIEIEVFGPPHDLHSGHYGEWAPNPAVLLAELVASMRDGDGLMTVDGFGEGAIVDPASEEAAGAVPDPGDLGFAPPVGVSQAAGALRPLLNVRGLRAGDVGEASRNVVPASAIASIDLRLVAGQEPQSVIEAIRRHVAGQGYHLVDGDPTGEDRARHRRLVRVDGIPGYPGVRTPTNDPSLAPVLEAVRAAAGEEPIVLPSFGGSVPLHHFQALGAPLAILPIANHDNNQHSEDENLRLANLWYGVDLMSALLGRSEP